MISLTPSFLQQVLVWEIQTDPERRLPLPVERSCLARDQMVVLTCRQDSPGLRRSDTPGIPDFDSENTLWWGLFSFAPMHYIRGPSVVTATSVKSQCVLQLVYRLMTGCGERSNYCSGVDCFHESVSKACSGVKNDLAFLGTETASTWNLISVSRDISFIENGWCGST